MDLDLAEYDQFDEIKFLMDHNKEQTYEGASSFLMTLSSTSSEPSNNDDANCENDFVFLPAPPPKVPINQQQAGLQLSTRSQQQQQNQIQVPQVKKADFRSSLEMASEATTFHGTHQTAHPLMAINSNGGNPFYNSQQVSPTGLTQTQQPNWITESFASKPIGLLDITANIPNNPNQLADLMHQIVTRSDTIYIAIPCDYCPEPVACPPSDITAWLNHMSRQHHCKVCPVCNKLVGLGPRRDIDIMRKHVMGHFDNEWLDRRANRVNFSFGLQQQWFSSGKCIIKDARLLGYYRN